MSSQQPVPAPPAKLTPAKLLQHMHQAQPSAPKLVNATSNPKAKAAARPFRRLI